MTNPLYWSKLKELKSRIPGVVATLTIIIMAVSFGTMGALIYRFFEFNYIQNPIVIQTRCFVCSKPTPKQQVIIKVVTSTPTPKVEGRGEKIKISAISEYDLVMKQKHSDTLWNIYQLETQRGKTDYCRIRGEGYGGFGVMTGGEVVCYPTFEKAVERANYWYSQILEGRTQVQALCKWSGHGDVNSCAYADKFYTL